jgi:hypothetical protein
MIGNGRNIASSRELGVACDGHPAKEPPFSLAWKWMKTSILNIEGDPG